GRRQRGVRAPERLLELLERGQLRAGALSRGLREERQALPPSMPYSQPIESPLSFAKSNRARSFERRARTRSSSASASAAVASCRVGRSMALRLPPLRRLALRRLLPLADVGLERARRDPPLALAPRLAALEGARELPAGEHAPDGARVVAQDLCDLVDRVKDERCRS